MNDRLDDRPRAVIKKGFLMLQQFSAPEQSQFNPVSIIVLNQPAEDLSQLHRQTLPIDP